ncbi:Muscle M-line assembly protein unc-89 [Wickerhamomyces ciferrii]|uniref:Muscle M-line assembly protein unc-89 n=1 Tax=Wickerhamomyces ciferrii (strain ATCC 14091 / BCRC 22168 / CBS 111 / JCM 3599 / NBRC 0793 / NRRL Y-1031 F-60-10) TaxID=1206466 RepID=K0KIC8_WICCF|nr:Muscle M-line assembly protein unc-89 [Wickerhamomyces ciferrii]CCH40908.1 Muscle M-line assembly protein unc-89 [Wickerhamomyces ciferrii]
MSAANSPASSLAPSPLQMNNTSASTPAITPRPSGQPIAKIVTSREWVLPPRPKPGRKPSADTPATKRKAQNRAAQRAFRERRATRVAELEEKLSEVEKERDINELNLKNIINKLQMENKYLLKNLNDVKNEYSNFKQSINQNGQQSQHQSINNGSNHSSPAVYSNGTVNAPSPLNYFKPSTSQANTPQIPQQYQTQQHQHQHQQHQHPHPHPHPHQRSSSQVISPAYSNSPNSSSSNNNTPSTHKTSVSSQNNSTAPQQQQQQQQPTDNYDCGVCIKDDCICESVGLRPPRNQQQVQQQRLLQQEQFQNPKIENIDSFQPMAPVSLKRKQPSESIEIDYTSKFAKSNNQLKGKKPMPKFKKLKKETNTDQISDEAKNFTTNVFDNSNSNFESPMEQCGFCSDDSPCVCREAAKEAASAIAELQNHDHRRDSTLPPIRNGSIVQQSNQKQNNHIDSKPNKLPVLHPGPTVEISEIHRSSISTPKATDSIEDSKKQLGDVTSTETKTNNGGGCTGNPGTCNQCQLDPMSTLFCTTIASKAEEDEQDKEVKEPTTNGMNSIERAKSDSLKKPSPVSPPLSNVSSKVSSPLTVSLQEEELNSLHKTTTNLGSNSNSNSNGNNSTPGSSSNLIPGSILDQQKGIFIPCADAYKTLSRHKEFNSVDFSTLVGKLTTRGMQVEVQSVANVLRELDRRLYN